MSSLLLALRALFVATVVCGVLYPLITLGIAQKAFPGQAHGSLARDQQVVRGSWLIGQQFDDDGHFHGRPSAAGNGYDAASSGASNLGPSNAEWAATARERASQWQRRTGSTAPVPIELVTASGSGLDPHLSLAAARYQIPSVARARSMRPEELDRLVVSLLESPQLGVLGEPRVNVLKLNAALDALPLR